MDDIIEFKSLFWMSLRRRDANGLSRVVYTIHDDARSTLILPKEVWQDMISKGYTYIRGNSTPEFIAEYLRITDLKH